MCTTVGRCGLAQVKRKTVKFTGVAAVRGLLAYHSSFQVSTIPVRGTEWNHNNLTERSKLRTKAQQTDIDVVSRLEHEPCLYY